MKSAQVNATVARDLVSNAGNSRIGDMNDFADRAPSKAAQFEAGVGHFWATLRHFWAIVGIFLAL